MIKSLQRKEGFTLVELMIVIAVLGILAAVTIPQLTGARAQAERSSMETLGANIHNAMAVGHAQEGAYQNVVDFGQGNVVGQDRIDFGITDVNVADQLTVDFGTANITEYDITITHDNLAGDYVLVTQDGIDPSWK